MVVQAIEAGDAAVLTDARRIGRYAEGEAIGSARELAGRLFTTVYMGSQNSSSETRDRWAGPPVAERLRLQVSSSGPGVQSRRLYCAR
jgi:hypothetical protein